MLSIALYLLTHAMLLSLHLSGGSFPRPLSAQENEILMYFRSRKKLQGEVSLNDSLDSDADGESLYLMDVVGVEDTMYLDIQDRDDCLRVRKLVHECLTEREEEVITSRYGLGGRMPRTQREVAKKLGISRSYVSRIEKRALQKLEEALGERE